MKKLKENRVCLKELRLAVPATFSNVFVSPHVYRIMRDQNGLMHTKICASAKSYVSKEQMAIGVAKNV